MSAASSVKLSGALKALIALPAARGKPLPAPQREHLEGIFRRISTKGEKRGGIGRETWLTLCTAGVMTVNSPETLRGLWDYAVGGLGGGEGVEERVGVAALMRETGLKCISFNGIPRTINGLGALREHLPEDVCAKLDTQAHRTPTPSNIDQTLSRGRALWDGIYEPHSSKLLSKLSQSHPDLPVHILSSHYSALLSDPFTESPIGGYKIGRVLTSLIAMTCLRAQQGVGPQVTSHVFGLKKALVPGGGLGDGEEVVRGQEWLCSDEGVTWALESVDEISDVVAGGNTSFAGPPLRESKL